MVEVCVGTGGNLALLLEACAAAGIGLDWSGLELDPQPLALALASEAFRRTWHPPTLTLLERLRDDGHWRSETSCGQMLWGDARQSLAALVRERAGRLDLVWHDAFSPRRCPQLWTVAGLGAPGRLLAPAGRWISYTSAAAVRETLRGLGLHVMALEVHASPARDAAEPPRQGSAWSGGTVASPSPLDAGPLWRPLSAMERDHLASAAGEPYRDPSGMAAAATILASRLTAQAEALARGTRASSGAWRQRWGVGSPRQ
ncbi:MAG: MnmC family methyltransferase [Cyanobacteriota bacterium]